MGVFWPRFVVDAAKTLWRPLNTVLFSSRGAFVSVRCLCLWPWCRRTLPPSGVNRSKYIATWCFTSNHFLGSFIFSIWETAKRDCNCETWCLKWIGELTSQSYKKNISRKECDPLQLHHSGVADKDTWPAFQEADLSHPSAFQQSPQPQPLQDLRRFPAWYEWPYVSA